MGARCNFRRGGGGINILGHDDQYPSEGLQNVVVRNCCFTEMNPVGIWVIGDWYGSGRGVMFNNKPSSVVLEAITMEGQGMGALGYFANEPQQPVGLTLRNWKYFHSEYGWKIDSGGGDVPPASANIKALMPDLVYEITDHDPGAQGYPSVPA